MTETSTWNGRGRSAPLVIVALALAAGSVVSAGCGGEAETPLPPPPMIAAPGQPPGVVPGQPPGVVPVAPAVAEDPVALADRQMNDKIGPIIRDCLNRFDQAVGRSRARYLQWIENEERGPTGRERNVYGLYQISGDVASCQSAINTANAAPPANPELQASASAYGLALAEVVGKVTDAYPYYERENYRDDSFERGRAMHAGLMAAFNAFQAAATELDDRISTINRGLTERRIARLESDPQRALQVMVERHLLIAEDTLELVHDWDVDNRRLRGIDGDALAEHVTRLEALTDQIAAAIAAGQAAAAVDNMSAHNLTTYSSKASSLLTQAKGIMRRVRDNQQFSRGELMTLGTGGGGWMVDGAPPRLVRDYNEMVAEYNRIRWVQ